MAPARAKDHYEALGVPRGATAAEIKSAYRKLAKKYHPDFNPGKKDAEDRFKEISQAYDVLSDEEKRKKYDQFGDAWQSAGQGAPPPGWTGRTGGGGFDFGGGGFDFESSGGGFGDILEELLGRGGGRGRARKGRDLEAELEVTLDEAHRGTRRGFQIGSRTVEANIPAGVREGSTLRLRGQGEPGSQGRPAGDVLLHIRLKPHPVFRVSGDDLEADLKVSPWEAALGAEVQVPTIEGSAQLKVPAGAQSGQKLRLRGQGLARSKQRGGRGDQFVRLTVALPATLTPDERRLFEQLAAVSRFDPRG
jgi:DnaJ-class molecular chaperone